jgi:hypothetical protein
MVGIYLQPDGLLAFGQGQGGGDTAQSFSKYDRGTPMQYAVWLYMAPIHRHFSAQKITSDFKDSDAKGAGQAIFQTGFNGGMRGGAFPDCHFLAFRLSRKKFLHD